MTENIIATQILDVCFKMHRKLGPGLFESVYEEILSYELSLLNVEFKRQMEIPVVWNSIQLEHGFRADLVIQNKVIVEIKSIENILPVHQKQVLTYLRLTGCKLGLLVNFNEALIKNGIQRIVNHL